MILLSFTSTAFWAYFLFFLEACFLAFFIPGFLLLRKVSLPLFSRIVTALITGIVLWGWQGAVFGYIHLRWLSYVYLIVAAGLFILHIRKKNKIPSLPKIRLQHWILIILIIAGVTMQLTTIWFTGVTSSAGLSFCCGNTSDALFHAALTNQLIERFPPYQPGMYGVIVHNYHYWSNLVVADLVRVFHLPLLATQYQYSNLLISLLLGLSAAAFGQTLKAKTSFSLWLVFFLYFGGDLAYLVNFIFGHGFNYNITSLEDGTKFLVNIPRAFSLDIFFICMTLLTIWLKKKDTYTGIVVSILLGTLIGFKVYTGIFSLIGIVVLIIYFLYRKNFSMITPLLLVPLLSAIVYIPVNANSGGLYFTGLWIFDNFIVNKDLGLQQWELAKGVYESHHNILRVIQYEGMFIGLYILSSFGSKLIGLIQTKKSLALLPREMHLFLLSGILSSMILGLFFQQSSGGANTFNFLVSVFMIGSIYTALISSYITENMNKKIVILFIVTVMLLTTPRVLREWNENAHHILSQPDFLISSEELAGYNYLSQKTNKNALILVDTTSFPKSKDAPYVSLLTNKHIYLSGTGILSSHGIDFSQREKVQNKILISSNKKQVYKLLTENKINYLIISSKTILPSEKKADFLQKVFQNSTIKIIKVIK